MVPELPILRQPSKDLSLLTAPLLELIKLKVDEVLRVAESDEVEEDFGKRMDSRIPRLFEAHTKSAVRPGREQSKRAGAFTTSASFYKSWRSVEPSVGTSAGPTGPPQCEQEEVSGHWQHFSGLDMSKNCRLGDVGVFPAKVGEKLWPNRPT